jgi:hypothetical protein
MDRPDRVSVAGTGLAVNVIWYLLLAGLWTLLMVSLPRSANPDGLVQFVGLIIGLLGVVAIAVAALVSSLINVVLAWRGIRSGIVAGCVSAATGTALVAAALVLWAKSLI